MKFGFIGAGNMGGAILRGALANGAIKACDTTVFGVNIEKLEALAAELGINPCREVQALVDDCDVIFLGFKPQKFDEVMPVVAENYRSNKLVVSMAAGISIAYIEEFLGKDAKVVRIMPNTPAQVGCGMTSASRNGNVSDAEIDMLMDIFCGIGKASEVPEDMIHAVIGASGSSPAFTYMYIDALAEAAAAEGMDKAQALEFAAQAVLGAAKMVLETGVSPEQLRINVCSPGGTTIEGVNKLMELDFAGTIGEAVKVTAAKSKKMTK